MMIDKRLINTVADSKKWIGITVLWNWVALIGGIISAVVFSYILQAAYFNELGPISAVIFGIVLVAALALRAFAGKKSVQASYFASTKVKHKSTIHVKHYPSRLRRCGTARNLLRTLFASTFL